MPRPRKSAQQVSESRRKVVNKRWHPELAEAATPQPPKPRPSALVPPRLPTDRPATLGDYDAVLGQPLTWNDAKTREQVQKEILGNEAESDAKATRRRKLFTAEQVETREREYDEIIFSQLARVADFCAELVPPERKEEARKKAREFITEIRRAIADAIGKRAKRD